MYGYNHGVINVALWRFSFVVENLPSRRYRYPRNLFILEEKTKFFFYQVFKSVACALQSSGGHGGGSRGVVINRSPAEQLRRSKALSNGTHQLPCEITYVARRVLSKEIQQQNILVVFDRHKISIEHK